MALLVIVMSAAVMAACTGGTELSLEERAQSIDKSLICPVCPGETIDQAQVELAYQMRSVVREKLAAGATREEVIQYFVDRYGEGVLAAPPKGGFSLVAWLVPLAAVGGAAVLLIFVIRAMRKGGRRIDVSRSPSEQGLEPYLSRVDRELGISQEGRQKPE